MENPIYYILISSICYVKNKEHVIHVTYSNGLRKIHKEYPMGDEIKTVINIDEEYD